MSPENYKIYIPQEVDAAGTELLLQRGYELVPASALDADTLQREIVDCDAVFLRTIPVTRELMLSAKKLKVISRFGVGLDNVDMESAKELGIYVLNTPEENYNTVAEHTIGFIIACAKNFLTGDNAVRTGLFSHERAERIGSELAGKTVGLLGFGKIAQAVARKASLAFDMQVVAFDPYFSATDVPEGVELLTERDLVFSRADFVSLHTPVTEETKESVGNREFKLMKENAFFINCSRGQLMREGELYIALKEHLIAGAALDVFNPEPPGANNPLFELENVIMTPHNAGYTYESSVRMGLNAAQGIDDVLSGRVPRYAVVAPE